MSKGKAISDVVGHIRNKIEDESLYGASFKAAAGESGEISILTFNMSNELVSSDVLYKANRRTSDGTSSKRLAVAREVCAFFNEFRKFKDEWIVSGKRHKVSSGEQSERDSWSTPDWLFGYFEKLVGGFTLDAAASEDNAKCAEFITAEQDGRNTELWGEHKNIWINPPFSGVQPWLEAAFSVAHDSDRTVCVVVPDDISTAWFQYAATHAAEMYGLISDGKSTGRVGFVSKKTGKVVQGNNKGTFVFVFRKRKRQLVTRWISRAEIESSI